MSAVQLVRLIAATCGIGAALMLAFWDKDGWGWFLFIAFVALVDL